MSDALNQYKSALTPQQVDAALTKLTETDVGDFVTRWAVSTSVPAM